MSQEKEPKKFDCWTCMWRGANPGDAHIHCQHPSLAPVKDDPLLNLAAIFAGVGRQPPITANNPTLNIEGNAHGIAQGWFNFPWSFDPTWLLNCDGYERREA